VALIPLALGLCVGLPLALRGRRRGGPSAVAGLFLFVAGLVPLLFTLRQVVTVVGLPGDNVPQLDFLGLQAIGALFSLATLLWLILRRRMAAQAGLLVGLLVLNAALQIVSWLGDASRLGGATGDTRLGVVGAILIELAFLWDLLMSGKEVTNRRSAAFPRGARVLLYLGYTVLLAAATLYFTSETYKVSGGNLPPFSDVSAFSQAGLVILGTALLVTLFIVGRGVRVADDA
jgi:hypothetical protein